MIEDDLPTVRLLILGGEAIRDLVTLGHAGMYSEAGLPKLRPGRESCPPTWCLNGSKISPISEIEHGTIAARFAEGSGGGDRGHSSQHRRSGKAQQVAGGIGSLELRWSKAPCRFCGTGCGVMVGVKDGRVVATHGDTLAEVNRGLNCIKGYFLSKIMYGGDRLTTPLLRKKTASLTRTAI